MKTSNRNFIYSATQLFYVFVSVLSIGAFLLLPDLAHAATAGTRFSQGSDIVEQEVKGSFGKMMVYLAIAVGMIFAVLMRQWLFAFGALALIIIIQVSTATADASFSALL